MAKKDRPRKFRWITRRLGRKRLRISDMERILDVEDLPGGFRSMPPRFEA